MPTPTSTRPTALMGARSCSRSALNAHGSRQQPLLAGPSLSQACSDVAGGLPCYLHLPLRHLWFLRQQRHPYLPQHGFGRRPVLLQHSLHPPITLQKLPPRLRQRRLRTAIPTVSSSALALREAKSPSAEATKVAPVSFIALPREITPASRPLAKSSKARTSPLSPSANRTPFL